jgi:hypothetical protein
LQYFRLLPADEPVSVLAVVLRGLTQNERGIP